ncbi:MAG: L-aspartate oxidase [Coriobacteriia bacterium]
MSERRDTSDSQRVQPDPGSRDHSNAVSFASDRVEDHPAATLPASLGRRYLIEFDTEDLPSSRSGVLVVGSGIAGLTAALHAAESHAVTLLTKGEVVETSTWHAQGGIAGAVGEGDSVELHLADTVAVGAGLCDEPVVRAVVGEAAEALEELRAFGVHFDEGEGGVDLHREGGHSLPRILHSGDATGAEVQRALTKAVVSSERIRVLERRFLVDLLTAGDRCVGALAIDSTTGEMEVHWAGAVVLATGGCGRLYRRTTNPALATGDGVAAAWRAGAVIADLEFLQFHPTALGSGDSPCFLITEALRGEGAYLLDCEEQRFMPQVHPLAELAPRDVVTRAIEAVMDRCGTDYVWLDARHLGRDVLTQRFPTITARCREEGLDICSELIPVAPAAHYMIGGVAVDVDGATSLAGLFASGEVTASGLHGANRLASNSLLEGLVLSRRVARALDSADLSQREARVASGPAPRTSVAALEKGRSTLQGVMSEFVGMRRSGGSLAEAADILADLARSLDVALRRPEELEFQNMLTVATLLTHAAWVREETRGVHTRLDFPDRDESLAGHILWQRGANPRLVRSFADVRSLSPKGTP